MTHRTHVLLAAALFALPSAGQSRRNVELTGQIPYPFFTTGGINVTPSGSLVAYGRISEGFVLADLSDMRNPVERFWYDPAGTFDNREAALVGNLLFNTNRTGADYGVRIWDVTNPSAPIFLGQVDDPSDVAYHTAFVDGTILYGASEVTGAFPIYDVSNPASPARLGEISDSNPFAFSHDCVVVNGVFYGSFLDGGFTIADVSNPASPVILARKTYPGNFTHNSWPTKDGRYLLTTDEVPGGFIRIWDIQSLAAIVEVATYQKAPDAIVHNVVIREDVAYLAYYEEGLVMLDLHDPRSPVEIANYDTVAVNQNAYDGSWGVNPFGRAIAVSDLGSGLLVFRYIPDGMLVAGPGPGGSSAPLVRGLDRFGNQAYTVDFQAYGSPQGGTNVGVTDLDGDGRHEILTGPGPVAVYGPHVRGWRNDSGAIGKVSFYAYGTLRYGANVAGGSLDGDTFGEMLTGPGPGAVFGPHVRGFDYDNTAVAAISKINLFAFGTLKYGVNVASFQYDADASREILAGAGPGSVFAAQVRGFQPDGTAISKVNYFPFPGFHGVEVSSGDFTGDGLDAIVAGRGAGPANTADVRIDETAATTTFTAFTGTLYGAEVAGGDVDEDGLSEVVAAPGPDPNADARVRGFGWDNATGSAVGIAGYDYVAYVGLRYGTKVAVFEGTF